MSSLFGTDGIRGRAGEGWLALAFMPVNNIASLSVLTAKLALMAWKRLTGAALIR